MKKSLNIFLRFSSACCLVASLVGCRPPVATTQTEVKSTENTETKIVERVVEVPVPGERIKETVYVECDSVTNKPKPFQSERVTGRSSSKTELDADGRLTTECACDEYKAQIKVKDTEISKLKQSHKQEQVTIVVTEYKTHWYDIVCRWIALAVIVFIIYRLRKLF